MITNVEDSIIEKQKMYIEKIKELKKGSKYLINTMGCKLNENDSEKMSGMLQEMGFIETKDVEEANLVLFNTCCIRENAEEKVFGKLRRTKKIKKQK